MNWSGLKYGLKKNLYFYDPKQSIKPTDVSPEDFNKLKLHSDSKIIQLFSQFRSKGGQWICSICK